MNDELTQYGFTWGPMEVTRITSFSRGKNRGTSRILELNTDAGRKLQIYVSPTGRSVRVWRDGEELK